MKQFKHTYLYYVSFILNGQTGYNYFRGEDKDSLKEELKKLGYIVTGISLHGN